MLVYTWTHMSNDVFVVSLQLHGHWTYSAGTTTRCATEYL